MNVRAKLLEAVDCFQKGDFARVESLSQEILAKDRHNPDALHLLGLASLEKKDFAKAQELIQKAIKAFPRNPDYHANLGNVFKAQARFAEAAKSYKKAIEGNPASSLYYFNYGTMLLEQKDFLAAVEHLRRAFQLSPQPDILPNLIHGLIEMEAYEEALDRIAQLPDRSQQQRLHFHLLSRCQKVPPFPRFETFISELQHSCLQEPLFYIQLADLFCRAKDDDRAEALLRQGLKNLPRQPDLLNHLGNLLLKKDQYGEAEALYQEALKESPNHPAILYNYGKLLLERVRLPEAEAHLEKALQWGADPSLVEYNLSQALLLRGDWTRGWALYEQRWHAPERPQNKPAFPKPEWKGQPLEGKSILVYPEQGYGDTLQFSRYIPMLASAGARVFFAAPEPLLPLFEKLPGVADFVQSNENVAVDYVCPLLSLPLGFATTPETVPSTIPYLQWTPRTLLPRSSDRPRIGFLWRGNPQHSRTRFRDIPLEWLRPLFALPADFYSLQSHPLGMDLQRLDEPMPVVDLGPQLKTFADAADVIQQLDLLISVDTAYVHLAGALGKPAWVFLPYFPDWRWGIEGQATPWYPQHRLFRQKEMMDWKPVISEVAAEVAKSIEPEHGL